VNAAQHILIFGVRLYRWVLSPAKTVLFGPLGHCRYTPSCSQYALEAIARHGALAGSWLALKRLGRCHPWGGCGEDPVPDLPKSKNRESNDWLRFPPRVSEGH
jgi:putative membrane protein insertion efficiency factor